MLGDADDVLVAVTLPGGRALTAVVLIEHNLGSIVKDAFVLDAPLDDVVDTVRAASGNDPDMRARPLAPADAKVRIIEAVERGAMTLPPERPSQPDSAGPRSRSTSVPAIWR